MQNSNVDFIHSIKFMVHIISLLSMASKTCITFITSHSIYMYYLRNNIFIIAVVLEEEAEDVAEEDVVVGKKGGEEEGDLEGLVNGIKRVEEEVVQVEAEVGY